MSVIVANGEAVQKKNEQPKKPAKKPAEKTEK